MYLGVDVGSVSTDAVLIDENKRIVSYSIVDSGFDHKEAIDRAIREVCQKAGISEKDIKNIVGTGYGRRNVERASRAVTEISCHAKGIHHLFPQVQTVIDIGGQDSKVIQVSESGYVESFTMNDKCAAGTGRFLEVMAHVMKIDVNQLGEISLQAKRIEPISSICTVFAESEVISKVAEGKPREDIVAGIHQAIGERLMGMAASIGIRKPVALTGGVAKNQGIIHVISKFLKEDVYTPEEPQIVGALGAASLHMTELFKPFDRGRLGHY